jgi:hypothetical protein
MTYPDPRSMHRTNAACKGQATKPISAEGIVNLRERIAVALGTNHPRERRALVQQVIDASTDREMFVDRPSTGQIQVALRIQLIIDTRRIAIVHIDRADIPESK